jgi:hypothetical protein
VLPDDQGRRAVRLQALGDQLEVLVVEHAPGLAVDVLEAELEHLVQAVVLE